MAGTLTSRKFLVAVNPNFTYNMCMMKNRTVTYEIYDEDGEWRNVTEPAIGGMKWGKREQIGDQVQSAYYDHTYYKVPFYGPCDLGRMQRALYRLYPARFNKFGGYTTVSKVEKLDDQHIKVEMCYHIGD